MPVMDGLTRCKTIKENPSICHIPVILLTAKHSEEAGILGMEYGADDYIEKPFSLKYLSVRIENILTSRQKLYKSFNSKPTSVLNNNLSKPDQKIINDFIEMVDNNISDPELNLEYAAKKLNISP